MSFGRSGRCLTTFFFSAILWIFATDSFAATTTNRWTNSISGMWQTATNWSSNQPPNSSFTYILITNANTKTVTIDATTPATNLNVQRLVISAPTGSTNTLALVNLTTNVSLLLSNSLTVDRGGVLSLSNSALSSAGVTVDHGGSLNLTNSALKQTSFTTFDIVNGSAWLDNSLLDCSALQTVRVGRTNNSSGNLTLNGGTMLAPELQIATSTGARGTLTLGGGTLNTTTLLTAGYGVNSTGMVSVTAGQLIATNDIAYIGKAGFGQMSISGGSATFAFLSVGNNANGQVSVTGGQLVLKPRTTNDWAQIGNIGVGQLMVSGGSVILYSEFHVGDDSSGLGTGSGEASITGGQLIATNDITAIGRYGPGQLTVSNASVWLTNVSVGRHSASTGTLNVQSNAQMFLLNALSIGRFSNSVGHVLVTGGLLSLTNDNIWIGREGIGDMTVSNGTVQAKAMFVGMAPDPTNRPFGTLTLAGGTTLLSSNLVVGAEPFSTGQVALVGGQLLITNGGGSAYLSVADGSVTLNSGSIIADQLLVTNAAGQFIFNGGTMQTKAAVVSNGLPFVVGNGSQPATLQLQGGIYSFANGLVISNNATVIGCGTIIGPITNYGTLATNCAPAAPVITSLTRTDANVTVFFTTLSGSNHVLEYKDTLNEPTWNAILPGIIGNGNILSQEDTNATVAGRFYRIHLE